MGAVKGFQGAGLFAKLAFILLIITVIFVWISFTCTGWGESTNGTHYGLWRYCSDDMYIPACQPLDGWANDWWAATQALVTFGFVGINVTLFLVVLYMFADSCVKNKEIAMTAAIIAITTGLLYLVGCIVFATKFAEYYIDTSPTQLIYKQSYAFGLSIVALSLEIVSGIFLIIDAKKGETIRSG